MSNNSTIPNRIDNRLTEVVVQAILFCLIVFANLFLVTLLLLQKRKTSRIHVLILHLCLADLLVAIFQVGPQLIEHCLEYVREYDETVLLFYGSNGCCKFVKVWANINESLFFPYLFPVCTVVCNSYLFSFWIGKVKNLG